MRFLSSLATLALISTAFAGGQASAQLDTWADARHTVQHDVAADSVVPVLRALPIAEPQPLDYAQLETAPAPRAPAERARPADPPLRPACPPQGPPR